MSFEMHQTLEYAKNQDSFPEALHEIFVQLAREIKMAGGRETTTTTDKDGTVTEVKRTGGDASRLSEIVTWLETQGKAVGSSILTAANVKYKPSENPFISSAKPAVTPRATAA